MSETSWHKQLRRFLMGHEPPPKPVLVPDNSAASETHNQSVGLAYVKGMLDCRQEQASTNPYYRRSEQGRAYDSGYRDEGKQ